MQRWTASRAAGTCPLHPFSLHAVCVGMAGSALRVYDCKHPLCQKSSWSAKCATNQPSACLPNAKFPDKAIQTHRGERVTISWASYAFVAVRHAVSGRATCVSKLNKIWRPGFIMENTIESTELIRWDPSILYTDIADPRLDSDLTALTAMARHFSVTYKGKLGELLGEAIKDYSEIEMLSGKISSYLFLRESTDLTNAPIKAK